jgi:hypothetical protein
MQTYNQIIKLNRQFADAHYQIKTFGNGEAYNIVLHDKENWLKLKSDMIQCAQDLLSFWAKDTTYPELDLIKTGSIPNFYR